MENKKNNMGLYIIIILLVAIVCLLVGFLFGSGLLSGNNKKELETNESSTQDDTEDKGQFQDDEIVAVSEVEGNALFEKVKVYNDYFTRDYSSNGLKRATNNQILYFLTTQLEGFGGYDKSGFTIKDLQNIADIYLNDDINVSYVDIHFNDSDIQHYVIYKLNNDGKYYFNQDLPGMSGDSFMAMQEFYVDGTYNKEADIYTINTKLLFNRVCSGPCGIGCGSFYSDAKLTDIIYTNETDDCMSFENVYEKVKDKLPITSFKFEKNKSGNYVLTGVEVK